MDIVSFMEEADSVWPAKRLGKTRGWRIVNTVMAALTRVGVIPHTVTLTTTGRRTGRSRSNPVTLVRRDGRTWLVAPYGPVAWVLNARATGSVSLSGRGATGEFATTELPPEQAGAILKEYVQFAAATRPYFTATKDSPVEAFVAEAHCHPVFELTPA